jgi:hypothetical protein
MALSRICAAHDRVMEEVAGETMTREMGFLIALCVTSAVGYAFLARADRIRAQRTFARRAPGRESGDAGPSVSSDSWSLAGRFSGSASSSGSSDSSGNPADFGSCGGSSDSADSGGGGDCGGGGGTD